ncbi:MAG: glycosyltransferase family 39 protein [Microgenomates group bacterium]
MKNKKMIIIALFISFVLRLLSLDQSLWLDEATTALVAKMPFIDFFSSFMPADFHPPLHYLVSMLWTGVFGISEVSLRMPSVIFGVLSVYVVYELAKALKQKWPIVPALFLATSGLHIYYSQEARMYAMATFLVLLTVLFFLKKKWFLFSLTLPFLFLTDYLSVLIIPVLFIYAFLYSKKNLRKMVLSFAPLGLAVIYWLPTFVKQLTNGLSVKETMSGWWGILGSVSFKNIILIPIKFIIGRVSIDDKTIYMVVVFVLLALYGYFIVRAKNKLVWSWFAMCFVLGVLISFFIPTLTYFRYLFILPAFYLLISENANKLIVVLVLAVNLTTSAVYLFNSNFHRENWRELANIVDQDPIILPTTSQKEALVYYKIDDNVIPKEELTPKDNQIWLSRYVWDVFDAGDSTRKYIENLGYNWSGETSLNGVVFWKYTKQ